MAVLFHTYDFPQLEAFAEAIDGILTRNHIPTTRKEADFAKDVVKIMSVTKAKGLGFGLVGLVGLGPTPYDLASREADVTQRREHLDEDVRYFYNGITRALEELVITYTTPPEGTLAARRVTKLQTALARVRGG